METDRGPETEDLHDRTNEQDAAGRRERPLLDEAEPPSRHTGAAAETATRINEQRLAETVKDSVIASRLGIEAVQRMMSQALEELKKVNGACGGSSCTPRRVHAQDRTRVRTRATEKARK